MLQQEYKWIREIGTLPKMVEQALILIDMNISEVRGPGSSPIIMQLAAEAGVSGIYTDDDMAWCAVGHTVVCLRAGKIVPFEGYDRLRAYSFKKFGRHTDIPMLGDTLIFRRPGGYHVGIYIAEDSKCFHVAGANQKNTYTIVPIEKRRLDEARIPPYAIAPPESVKKYIVNSFGTISRNER